MVNTKQLETKCIIIKIFKKMLKIREMSIAGIAEHPNYASKHRQQLKLVNLLTCKYYIILSFTYIAAKGNI